MKCTQEIANRSDMRLVARSTQWNVDQSAKEVCKKAAIDLLDHADPRIQISAVRAIIEMDKVDQRDAHKQLDLEREANQSKVQNLTLNQFNLSPEAVYRLMDGMSSNVIEHES